MIRKTLLVCILAGCVILCTGCGMPDSADTAWGGNGSEESLQGGSIGGDGNSTPLPGGNIGEDGNSAASQTGNAASGSKDAYSAQTGTKAGKEMEWTDVQPEEIFSYEKKGGQFGEYLVITGIAQENRERLERYVAEREKKGYKGIFLQIPEEIKGIPVREIGEEAFADMGMEGVEFRFPDTVEVVGDRAFRDTGISNLNLPSDLEIIGEEAFRNTGIRSLALPPCLEYDADAPNFGYDDWQWPGCSSWCGAMYFEQEVEATSELVSKSGRYSAGNVLEQSRTAAWAEGAEGYGIGEGITYCQTYAGLLDNKWEAMGPEYREPVIDGFIRYTEICIVNGYAKNAKTWEENGRVRTLLMYVEDKLYARLELEDTILPQYFALPQDDIKVLNGGTLETRFEIAEIYPGSVYEDTCLTGLIMEFSGRFAH